ncbi:MAG: hypothetical protein PF694_13745 [Bacteroidetes bacterium]|nr:hypothetical protein [Bacteroidota bacterium]
MNILAVIFMIYNGEIVFFKGFLTSFNLMTDFSIESLPAVHFFYFAPAVQSHNFAI